MEDKEFRLRYARQIAVPEIGIEGQKKLRDAKVLIIGAGALGSMVAMQLSGAGIGTIGIADFDTIDVSNLQRQFFFRTKEAGKLKIEIIEQRIRELNPEIKVKVYPNLITKSIADSLFSEYDFIIDGTDNPESKKITGKVAGKKGKGCCIGGVSNFRGQVMTYLPGDACLEDFFGEVGGEGFLPCSLGGVLGPAASLCASLQASETIKYITGAGETLSGKILLFNLLENTFKIFKTN